MMHLNRKADTAFLRAPNSNPLRMQEHIIRQSAKSCLFPTFPKAFLREESEPILEEHLRLQFLKPRCRSVWKIWTKFTSWGGKPRLLKIRDANHSSSARVGFNLFKQEKEVRKTELEVPSASYPPHSLVRLILCSSSILPVPSRSESRALGPFRL